MSRIILKVSGEALKEENKLVADNKLEMIFNTIKLLQKDNHQIGIVIGGGNFFRGREHQDMNKVTADTIGMLGTVMNALYLKDYLEKKQIKAETQADSYFPQFQKREWNKEILAENEDNGIYYEHVLYRRKK